MWDIAAILLTAALINNFVLVQFLGLCPFVGTSARLTTAIPMSLATMFVITVATLLTHWLHRAVLAPLDLEYLRIVAFIVVIASVVQLTELFIRHTSPLLFQVLGMYLPLITSNCAVLAIALMSVDLPLIEAVALGIGAALGFGLVLVLFAGMRERIEDEAAPRHMRGVPLAFVTIGVMALAFSGFKGIL